MMISLLGIAALSASPMGLIDVITCANMPMMSGCFAPKSLILLWPMIMG